MVGGALLASYVETWSVLVAARKEMGDSPILDGKRSGEPVKNPAWTAYVQAAALMTTLARELGLTPYARARMSNPTDPALADTGDLD